MRVEPCVFRFLLHAALLAAHHHIGFQQVKATHQNRYRWYKPHIVQHWTCRFHGGGQGGHRPQNQWHKLQTYIVVSSISILQMQRFAHTKLVFTVATILIITSYKRAIFNRISVCVGNCGIMADAESDSGSPDPFLDAVACKPAANAAVVQRSGVFGQTLQILSKNSAAAVFWKKNIKFWEKIAPHSAT